MSIENETKKCGPDWLESMRFIQIFRCFRIALQPGKLVLGLMGIFLIFLSGYILDGLTPSGSRVAVSATMFTESGEPMTELDAFLSGRYTELGDMGSFRRTIQQRNEEYLQGVLTGSPLNMDFLDAKEAVRKGKALSKIREKHAEKFDLLRSELEKRYEARCRSIQAEYEDKDDQKAQRDRKLEELETAYRGLFESMIQGNKATDSFQADRWLDDLVKMDIKLTPEESIEEQKTVSSIRSGVLDMIRLARVRYIAEQAQGKGVFDTLIRFSSKRFHDGISALVWDQNLSGVKAAVWDTFRVDCWAMRYHWLYALLFGLIKLSVAAVMGGAICRIAALQFTRDEKIGALHALRFSMKRFGSFFAAPLIPLGIIAVICLLIFVGSLAGAIPGIGEILAGILTGLSLVGGFVATLVLIGLIAGFNLMYPAIAVEGSDAFDGISRSFSYIYSRPWRMAFYSFVAAVYGAICYLFLRLFIYLILMVVQLSSSPAMNLDGSGMISIRGKFDAIWPAISFANLHPGVTGMGLSLTESVGAFFISVWISLLVGFLMAYLASYYFTANTLIYLLLREQVDATDLEDVYVEEDIHELVTAEAEEAKPAPSGEPSSPGTLEKPAEPPAEKKDDLHKPNY